jgi:hypothetical protein
MCLVVYHPVINAGPSNPQPLVLYDELDDAVLTMLLENLYKVFVMFNGTYSSLVDTIGMEKTKKRLSTFFDFYVPTIKFSNLAQTTEISGFQYLPVDRPAFLMTHSLSRSIKTNFPSVHSVSILYDHKLVHSELPQADMKILFDLDKENMRPMYTYLTILHKDSDDDAKEIMSLDTKL